MAYTPDATDIAEPVITRPASTAAAEFRTLKAFLQSFTTSAGKSVGTKRQVALAGPLDASQGVADFIKFGTLLRPSIEIDASDHPLVLAFANGYNAAVGSIDSYESFSTTITDPLGADLPIWSNVYFYREYGVGWGVVRVPPQYGPIYQINAQSLHHFEGANGAAPGADSYGNAITVGGNAQLSSAQQKFGSTSLLLDGTGDYVQFDNITDVHGMGNPDWTIEAWVRWNTLPAASTQEIFCVANSSNFGIRLALNDTAGTKKLSLWLSSDGTTNDIASAVLGLSTTWATGTWYHIILCYDEESGGYRVYKDGVLDITVASGLRVNRYNTVGLRYGAAASGVNGFNGWIDEVRFSPCARYGHPGGFDVPTTAFTVDGHWFSTARMQMFEVTGESSGAGVDPTFTQRNRLFLGEFTTNSGAVTRALSYAYNGEYLSSRLVSAASTSSLFNHFIGIPGKYIQAKVFYGVLNDDYDERVLIDAFESAGSTYGWTCHTATRLSIMIRTFATGLGWDSTPILRGHAVSTYRLQCSRTF